MTECTLKNREQYDLIILAWKLICGIQLVESTAEPRLSGFLDYPDFFSGPNLVMNIYLSRSRFVAISFLKLQHAFKGAVRCEGFCSQRAKAALVLVVNT